MSAEKLKAALDEAQEHLTTALEHHEAGRHSAVKRRIELARGCIQRASEGMQDPTNAMGSQNSGGQGLGTSGPTAPIVHPAGTSGPPRSFDPEVRRQQDQLRYCKLAYDARQRQMRGLR